MYESTKQKVNESMERTKEKAGEVKEKSKDMQQNQ